MRPGEHPEEGREAGSTSVGAGQVMPPIPGFAIACEFICVLVLWGPAGEGEVEGAGGAAGAQADSEPALDVNISECRELDGTVGELESDTAQMDVTID